MIYQNSTSLIIHVPNDSPYDNSTYLIILSEVEKVSKPGNLVIWLEIFVESSTEKS